MKIILCGTRASLVLAACVAFLLVPAVSAQVVQGRRQAMRQQGMGMNGQAMRQQMQMAQGYGYGNRNAMARQQNNSQFVGALQTSLSLLTQADHDYNGHRAKAVRHVTTAIRALQGGMGRKHGNEPGARADGQWQPQSCRRWPWPGGGWRQRPEEPDAAGDIRRPPSAGATVARHSPKRPRI